MPKKIFTLEGVGKVSVYKRRGVRVLRLRVGSDGAIRVTIPSWVPYAAGVRFVNSKRDWIKAQSPEPSRILHDTRIGKKHRVVFSYRKDRDVPKITISNDLIRVEVPFGYDETSTALQKKLLDACIEALRIEAKEYLPRRLQELAMSHNFSFKEVSVKRMKSRWGSCTSQKNISLNIFLMQLDDELIDYVLMHELLHTKIQAHGAKFWSALAEYVPDLAEIRRRMRAMEPRLFPL